VKLVLVRKRHHRAGIAAKVAGAVVALGALAFFVRLIPEVVRYVKMESM
jgi:hypothetical protein